MVTIDGGMSTPPGTPLELWVVAFMRIIMQLIWPIEVLLIHAWGCIPLRVRYTLTTTAFDAIVGIHRLLDSKSGYHPSLSVQAHALSTVMKGGRYLPMSIPRIRLGLDSISYCYPPIEGIPTTEVDLGLNSKGLSYYIRSGGASPSLGQDVFEGRRLVVWVGLGTGCDVFVADYQRYPEGNMQEALDDAIKGYKWAAEKYKPENIMLLGISSGGGIATLVVQHLLKENIPQPAGLVLLGPWLVYIKVFNSIRDNTDLDLTVSPRYPLTQPKTLRSVT
ncbi:hypothetical protein AAMO2058_000992600 [Amorphochlora amoebiformis]